MEIQEGRCFYCERRLGGAPHVDHLVPWSRYPVDLGHNFVVALWRYLEYGEIPDGAVLNGG